MQGSNLKVLSMAKSPFSLWPNMGLAFQGAMLAIEAQQVIALRLTKMAFGGPAAQKEAELMVSEKLAAMAEGGQMMMMGALGGRQDMNADKVVELYRRKVRANRRRLSA
jgi:hypothetical protein